MLKFLLRVCTLRQLARLVESLYASPTQGQKKSIRGRPEMQMTILSPSLKHRAFFLPFGLNLAYGENMNVALVAEFFV